MKALINIEWIDDPATTLEILVVDDNEVLSRITAELLEQATGARVVAVDSARAALNTFARSPHRWQAVVTDFHMPELNGHELAERLRDIRPGVPIIIMSGAASVEEGCAGIASPIQFVRKPFRARALEHALRRVIELME